MSKASALIDSIDNEFLGFSSVWNYYHCILGSVGSTVRADMQRIFDGSDIDSITVICGAKGRSQHSKTELLLFAGCVDGRGKIFKRNEV